MINKTPKVDGRSLFLLVFESVMAVLYLCVAYLLLFTHAFESILAEGFRLPLGVLFSVYGLFRIYRAAKRIKLLYDEVE